jgi:hypothetical protein
MGWKVPNRDGNPEGGLPQHKLGSAGMRRPKNLEEGRRSFEILILFIQKRENW